MSLWEANGAYDILKATAYGNSLTADFALAALKGENLGKGVDTDFLAISFSSTDYVGHQFGVNSREIEDTYYRLDLDLERLLKALDAQVGPGNYSLFLTADHAAVQVPSYLKDLKIPSGYFDSKVFKEKLNTYVADQFGSEDLIENISNYQVFLNRGLAAQLDIDLKGDARRFGPIYFTRFCCGKNLYLLSNVGVENTLKAFPIFCKMGIILKDLEMFFLC